MSDLETYFSNAEQVGEGEDRETFPFAMPDILTDFWERTGNWPRTVQGTLFVDDPRMGVSVLASKDELFGWIANELGQINWFNKTGCVSKAEFFAEVVRQAPEYDALETLPHFPPIENHYYSHPKIEAGDGSHLAGLLDFFCPETHLDRDLIKAMFVTQFWGGPGGTRPAFAITAPAGRGMGKSDLAKKNGELGNSHFEFSHGESIDRIKTRLLTEKASTKRCYLIDNIKTNRLSWGELEGLITSPVISGHRLFKGERAKPNTLTGMLTMNGPGMSRDMAQRCVIIKLGRPNYSPTWGEETTKYIFDHRWDIIADIKAFFDQEPVTLAQCSRWGTWERVILARMPEPEELQKVIAERQGEINADDEEGADIEDHFGQQLDRLGYDVDHNWVHIPNIIAAEWYGQITRNKISPTAVTRTINQLSGEGMLKRLFVNPSRHDGRGLLWKGGEAHKDVLKDLERRIWLKNNPDESWRNGTL